MTKKKSRPKKPRRAKKKVHLKPRVLRFVELYLIDLNATQAAIDAGYSPASARQTASELLRKTDVRAAVQAAMHRRSKRTAIEQDRVLQEVAACAFSNIKHYVIDENDELQLAAGAPKDAMSAVASFRRKPGEFGTETEIKLWDKPTMAKLAGRHVGLFPDRLEVTGKNGKPIEVEAIRSMTDAELKAELDAIAKLAAKL